MKFNEKSDIKNWPVSHYVYVEKTGNIPDIAPKVWETLHKNVGKILEQTKVSGYMSLYKPQGIYRAGVVVDAKPAKLPEGFHYVKFEGGKYTRFVLTGSYANLPKACMRAGEIIEQKKTQLRDDFFIENYVNDPRLTPEDQLVTEILFPTK